MVTQLLRKFKPEDTMTRVELHQEMNQISMKKGQEPAVLFEQISTVENRYNSVGQVSENDLIVVILDAAPAEYQAVLKSEQRFKGEHQLRKEDLVDAMTQHWLQMNRRKKPNNEADNELNLSAIVCYECNEEGHKANKCPNRANRGGRGGGRGGDHGAGCGGRGRGGQGGRFQGNCNHCDGKAGHKATQCWDKEENAAQRPINYRPAAGGKVKNAYVDGGSTVEFLLMAGITFPNKQSYLSDPSVWIADTAATVHTTPHSYGAINKRKATREDSITVGSGESESVSMLTDIPGTMCDKYGNELKQGTLKNVTLLPMG